MINSQKIFPAQISPSTVKKTSVTMFVTQAQECIPETTVNLQRVQTARLAPIIGDVEYYIH